MGGWNAEGGGWNCIRRRCGGVATEGGGWGYRKGRWV